VDPNNGNRIVYLTFDDGPSDAYTNRLLDILAKYGVKATFFVTGSGDDALIKREFDEGHTVALHSSSHSYAYIYANVDNYFADLYAIRDRVQRITGYAPSLIRFPGGSSNTVSALYDGGMKIMSYLTAEVERRGFNYADWNVSSGDAGGATTADQVFENVVYRLSEGRSVVLQHDVKGFSVDAVERIIQYGQANGYTFLPMTSDSFMAHHGVNN
jgi:peptidoglycan/xylan/chitin deacetylase (PgdA/CDA1 family)